MSHINTNKPLKYLLLICLLFSVAGAQSEGLKITASTWPPYVENTEIGKGLVIELVETALKRSGYSTTLIVETWSRALEGTQLAIYDAIAGAWYSEARAETMAFSEPFLSNEIIFITKNNRNITFNTLSDLRGYVIGVSRDFAYEQAFDKSTDLIKVPRNHVIQNLNDMLEGKIDITVAEKRVAIHEISKYMPGKLNEFKFLTPPLSNNGLHLAVTRQQTNFQKIINDFDKTITEMKQDGSFDQIMKKYGF